jgi:hypothetical protein
MMAENIFTSLFLNYLDLYFNFLFWSFVFRLVFHSEIKYFSALSITFCTRLSKTMDGIWNRYNLRSTGRIYRFGILKCLETFKVLDLSWYILICPTFVALETSKRNSISCHVFWIMSHVTVSMADVFLSCRCWIFPIFSAHTMFLTLCHASLFNI